MPKMPQVGLEILAKRAFAHLATVSEEGLPQVTPVWVDYDGQHILVNTAKGRKKDENMRRTGKVALSILDPDNPYSYLGIQGEVEVITEEGAVAHIHQLAHKYTGKPFNLAEGEVRVLYKIKPTRIWPKA